MTPCGAKIRLPSLSGSKRNLYVFVSGQQTHFTTLNLFNVSGTGTACVLGRFAAPDILDSDHFEHSFKPAKKTSNKKRTLGRYRLLPFNAFPDINGL
jgi:hypothetical protein